ncbi:MAG: ATP-binding protein [Nocardioides sp.]
MPLNRPALPLGSGPDGVHVARRWAGDTCRDIGRPDLVECAEMGVAELVTNALLHGEPPIHVSVRGTDEHPRIEVHDCSTEPPVLPGSETLADFELEGEDDVLLTFGRGLDIVARCATAWGADIEASGKTTWFVPSAEPSEDGAPTGVITGEQPAGTRQRRTSRRPVHIDVKGVPLRSFLAFRRHFQELQREVRLLALAHETDYPLAKRISDVFGTLDRDLRYGIEADQIETAVESGKSSTDLQIDVSEATSASIGQFLDLLDLADEFCRQERLLSLARTPEQRRFQRWFLGEFVRQQQGELPVAWPEARRAARNQDAS